MQRFLYPAVQPNFTTYIEVSSVHSLFVREYGNKKGIPVVVLHGGPGGGCDHIDAQFFDPEFYRIILIDQRGAGKSTPFATLKENTTQDLVEDLEKIRAQLNINKWLILGGSWGSALALLYGEEYPTRCLGFILRGVWLGGIHASENILLSIRDIFPSEWEAMEQLLPENQKNDFCKNFCKLVLSNDKDISNKAIKAFMDYDLKASFLHISTNKLKKLLSNDTVTQGVAKMFCHYFINDFFLQPNQILNNIKRIHHLPCVIVNGRYDVITRPHIAYKLHKAWHNSKLMIVEKAGHSRLEKGIALALLQATDWFKKIL